MNDFYSDTKTKPSHAMLEYALERTFGDEQQDERSNDPGIVRASCTPSWKRECCFFTLRHDVQ